jgi:hypothetical protein
VKALIIKFIMVTAILWLILGGMFEVSIENIFIISILLTGVSYVVGDLYVLPKFGNTAATIADFGLAFAGIWVLGSLLFEQTDDLAGAALISAAVVAIGELFFHRYMKKQVLYNEAADKGKNMGHPSEQSLQTEFGSDMAIKPAAKKAKNKINHTITE